MKLDPLCDVCDDNGMSYDFDQKMDVPCPSCNAEPVTDALIQDNIFDHSDAPHPSREGFDPLALEHIPVIGEEGAPTEITKKDLEDLAALADMPEPTKDQLVKASEACMEMAKRMMQASLYIAETMENAAKQFLEWSETFKTTAMFIPDSNDGDPND